MDYGNAIKQLRGLRSMKQKELADAIGVSAPQLSLIEHNKRPLTTEIIDKIAHVLQIPPPLISFFAAEPGDLRGVEEAAAAALRDAIYQFVTSAHDEHSTTAEPQAQA